MGGWDVDEHEGLREWEGDKGVLEDEGRRNWAGDSARTVGDNAQLMAGEVGVLLGPGRVTRPTLVRRGRGGPLITCPCRVGVGEL